MRARGSVFSQRCVVIKKKIKNTKFRKIRMVPGGPGEKQRENVLFIGTQFSNLYTAVDTPDRGRVYIDLLGVVPYDAL